MNTLELFTHQQVDASILRRRAYNHRWATIPPDCLALTTAEPDFPVAPEITTAIQDYVECGYLPYAPPEGLPEFRSAAARAARERWGMDWGPESILATDSAAAALFIAARFALSAGDEALIFDPVDFLFGAAVRAAGATPVASPVDPATGRFDFGQLRQRVTPATRMICICNPHNPIGRVLTEEELAEMATLAVEHDLWILSDEIWSDIVYPPARHTSVTSLGPEIARRTITAFGFSKSYGMSGLRVGFLVAHPEVTNKLVEASLAPTTATGVATISQIAAVAALEQAGGWLDAFVVHLRGVRDYAVGRLNAMPGVRCTSPQGTYLLFADVRGLGMGTDELVDYLMQEGRVSIVPGGKRFFGPGSEGYVRISFATSMDLIQDGLDRIDNALSRL
jgi:aspartate/methionine/tyrosine aminotransferase